MKEHNMKTVFKLLISICILAGAGYLLVHNYTQKKPTSRTTDTLVVGTNVGYPPFIFTNESGNPIGFDVDVATAIAHKLNKQLVIKDMAFDALLLALTHGSVDMIIGGISLTQARKKTGLLIPYYGTSINTVALFYPKTRPHPHCTLASAAEQQLTICTQAGSMFEEILTSLPGMVVKTLPDISDIVLEVTRGTSDCGLLDTDSVRSLTATSQDLESHIITIPPYLRIEGFGIGITPQNEELRNAVIAVINALRHEGTIAAYAEKWFN